MLQLNNYLYDFTSHYEGILTVPQLRQQACKVLAINIDSGISDEQVRAKAFEVVPEADYKQFLNEFKKPNLDRDFYRWQYRVRS